ncbi:MAG: GNAT family N-acetyltransferase [Mycobacteriales bacterium]
MEALERQRLATAAVWRADVARRRSGAWLWLDGLACHTTGLGVRPWNGAHLVAPDGMARLDEAAAWFDAWDVPWGVLVPAEMDVAPPGLTHLTDQPVMLRDLAGLPTAPDLDLRWDAGLDAAALQAEGFSEPRDRSEAFVLPKVGAPASAVVVGYDGSRPVATATVFWVDGVAAVYGVATVPSHRRQGWGAAVTTAVLHEAARLGCDLAFLNPSEPGRGVYARLGFEDAPPWRVFVPPAG